MNAERFVLRDCRAPEFFPDGEKAANDTVAVLLASAARGPVDCCVSGVIGELSTQSGEFRARWAQHNLRQHVTGVRHLRHPIVGELSLSNDRHDLVADPGLTMFTYAAEPGSRDKETLRLLGSWAATQEQPAVDPTDER